MTDSERMRALRDPWKALWARCAGAGLFQSFEYCLDAWELVEQPKGHELACLAGWRGDQLVAVWPFVTYRNRLWTHARNLVASGVELHEILLDDTVDGREWTRQAWRALTADAGADVVELSFFQDSPHAPALQSLPAYAVESSTSVAVHVDLRQEGDWDKYYNSLGKSFRKDFAKSRRRLEALGVLDLAVLEAGDAGIDPLVDWTIEQKRRWAERTGKRGAWIYSEQYLEFLKRQLADPGASSRNVLLKLTLNGDLLATQIGAVSKGKLEAVIAGFNSDYDKYSPGARLNDAMMRWAWEHGVDCDLGAGGEPYKLFWSRNRERTIINRRMAVSWLGRGAFAARRAVRRVQGWRAIVAPRRQPRS